MVLPVVEARVQVPAAGAPRRPARRSTLWVDAVGPATFAFDYEVTRDGLLLATARPGTPCATATTGRGVRMPDWFRALFAGAPSTEAAS